MPPPPQASAAAAFFERTLSDDGDCENGFASELGEREAVCDAYEAPPPSFYRQPPPDTAAASAKAAAWAAGVPSRSAALLSSAQLDALWAAVRAAATALPATTAAVAPWVPRGEEEEPPASASPSASGGGGGGAALCCREPAPLAAAAAPASPSPRPSPLPLSPRGPRGKVLTYAAYRKAAEDAARGAAGPAAAALLTARAFLRLAGSVAGGGERGGKGGEGEKPTTASSAAATVVDVESLCDYLGQRAGQLQMHVHLSCFDAGGGAGWLSEAGAAAFVRATLPQLARSGCGDSFEGKLSLEDHAAIAARKLVFFHGRSGGVGSGRDGDEGGGGGGGGGGKRLRIRDVLAGRALAELLELAVPAAAAPSSIDDDYQQQQQQQASPPGGGPSNWFSAASAAAAAAAFASGAAAGVEAAAAAGVDLSEARVDFPFTRLRGTETPASSTANISAAEAASFGSLGIPAAALCELGDGTLSPLFAARLVEEKGDARALIAVFASSSSSSPDSPAPSSSSSSSRAEGEEGESCSDIDEANNNGNNSGKEEGVGEQDGDEMNVDGRKSQRHRQRKRRNPPPLQPPPPPQPPSLATTAGLSLPSFLDFLLAWSDRNDPKSVSWLWPALDLRGQGSLTRLDVERLFEPVRRLWVERGQYDALRSCDVAAEVFDIVAPSRPGHDEVITKRDLCGCPMAGSVIGMLCDVGCFYEHDSRELQLQQATLGTDGRGEEGDDFGEQEEGEGQGQRQQQEEDLIVLDEKLEGGSFYASDDAPAMAAAA